MSQQLAGDHNEKDALYTFVDGIKIGVTLAFVVGGMVLLAGRWDWWAGWIFLGVFITYCLILFAWLAWIDPGLARERRKDADERNQAYEFVIIPLMGVLEMALLIVATLDAGRFGWSSVPAWARVIGWLMLGITGAILPWVFKTNTFASGVGRIQEERSHHVISDGPYRYVRHPMYVGVCLAFIGLPLVLGSWWAFIPTGLLLGVYIIRTTLEDRMLHEQLPGYAEYAQRTRFRMIPGVW